MMRLLNHPNIVHLKHYFYSTTDKNEVYLNLVLEYVSETVYRASRHYSRASQCMPILYVQLYTYQVHNSSSNVVCSLINCVTPLTCFHILGFS